MWLTYNLLFIGFFVIYILDFRLYRVFVTRHLLPYIVAWCTVAFNLLADLFSFTVYLSDSFVHLTSLTSYITSTPINCPRPPLQPLLTKMFVGVL